MDELVKRLRNAAQWADKGLVITPSVCLEAADAIEELQTDNAALNGTVSNLVQQIADLSKPRWIPVEERLPEQFTPVLVYYNRNGYGGTGVAEYYHDGDTKMWRGSGFIPTHWMPLPEPPEEE